MAWRPTDCDNRLGRRLKLRDLHILLAVVDVGSMAKAASRLGITQPAISQAVADLEVTLGVRLLDRSPRGPGGGAMDPRAAQHRGPRSRRGRIPGPRLGAAAARRHHLFDAVALAIARERPISHGVSRIAVALQRRPLGDQGLAGPARPA